MFPSSDMLRGIEHLLERDRIANTISDAHPELAEKIEVDDAKPLLKISAPRGGYVIIARMTRQGITRWIVGVPDGPEPTIHEPENMAGYVEVVEDALGLDRVE